MVRNLSFDGYILLIADLDSSGFLRQDETEIDPDDLPLSNDLKDHVANWIGDYEMAMDAPANNTEPPEPFDLKAFSEEGRQIAIAIKAELPDWTIFYFDEQEFEESTPLQDKSTYEYEINLSPSEPLQK